MSSWKGLVKQADRLERIPASLYGVAADSPEQLRAMRDKLSIPQTLLSDPDLRCAEVFKVATSRRHPMARRYPRGAFLQPALFVWQSSGELVYQWRQTPKVTNLFGASNRPTPEQTLEILERSVR